MRLQLDSQIKVTVLSGPLALALDPDARTLDHAGRNLDKDLAPGCPHPCAATGRTGDTFHHGPIADLATFAGEADPATGWTRLGDFGLDGSLATTGRLLKGDLDRVFDVLTAFAGDRPSPRPFEIEAGKAAGLAREERVEEVAEVADSGGAGASACLRLILAGATPPPPHPVPLLANTIAIFSPLLGPRHLLSPLSPS